MGAKRKTGARETRLAFDALSIEGGLLSPEWLSKVAQLQASTQAEPDYRIPKGLNLRDEIGRYWRIAQAHWIDFNSSRDVKANPRATSERFVLALLREALDFTSLLTVEPTVLAERAYPIGQAALGGRVPVVIAPADIGLDTLVSLFGDGNRKRSAFGVAQEYLNAQEGALWGIASDGSTLRIVRDNASLTRPAWIEADLQQIFTEERYADFAALWLLCHETRFGRAGQAVTECALEVWRNAGRDEGTRAREHLRRGVEEALVALGQGFLAHADNHLLRAALQNGTLTAKGFFNQLLRFVYRLIFLLTVEERGLLHPNGTHDAVKALYEEGYSLRRLRERSVKRSAHDRFSDLWEAMKIVCRGLATGEPRLGLPALAGIFATNQCPALDGAKLENRSLLLALFKLAWLRNDGSLSRVNWRDMGPEELGSVYESLLELVPQITKDGRQFAFATGGETKGNARKTTGSYYTPDSLVQVLLDSALEPVIAAIIARNPSNAADALLALSCVDPACGSGHFLLAAARRLAAHVARVQANGTPSAADYRHALRQVVGRCIFGVDLNPMAVDLCKVALWMEAVEPGLPLTFLNSHIQHGNALLGTTPELMGKGIPDAAWEPIEGDDKKMASALKKRNKKAAEGQRSFDALWSKPADTEAQAVTRAVTELEAASDANVEALAKKEASWDRILDSPEYRHQKFAADAWCAAFVWPKQPGELTDAAPTNELWRQLRDGQGNAPALTTTTITALADEYHFFHWHLQFPQVFAKGGFDLVIGNPPWEELTPSAKEFFSVYDPEIRSQDKTGEEAISRRLLNDPKIAAAWISHCRRLYGQVHSLKATGRHTLFAPGNLGKGDFNVYRMFVETALRVTRADGFVAQFVPETLYSGATTMAIRQELLEHFEWRLLVGLENVGEVWFKNVHSAAKFCLYVARKGAQTHGIRVAFNIKSPQQLSQALTSRTPILLSPSAIRSFSPEALSIMELSSPVDFELATRMHAAWPAFGNESRRPPQHKHMRELDMTNDSSLFRDAPPGLPLYEGRMVGLFDHRAKGYRSGKARNADWQEFEFSDRAKRIQPQFYVRQDDLPGKLGPRTYSCRVGFCNIASPTNERTLVSALIPPGVVCGNKVPTITFDDGYEWFASFWVGVANSFVMDYLARKKVSLTMTNTIVDSLPFPRVTADDPRARMVVPLVARLCCVGVEMQTYWNTLVDQGWVEALDTEREGLVDDHQRRAAEAELNAVVALDIFGLSRADIGLILDTFPVVEKRDRKIYGDFRTKALVLKCYDDLVEAAHSGKPYQSRVDSRRPLPVSKGGNIVKLSIKPGARPQPVVAPAAISVPDLAAVAANVWIRPHTMERGEIQAAILAVVKANGAPMPRLEARLAALLCLEPQLLMSLLDKIERAQWARVVGGDAEKAGNVSIDATTQHWGAALTGLRGRERLLEDLQQNTWALGIGTNAVDTSGWPEGRAGFVVNVLRRLQASMKMDAIIPKLPSNVQQWLANAA